MDKDKLRIIQDVVWEAHHNTLRNSTRRREFAKELAHRLNIWDNIVESFVEEMTGLTFTKDEDRETFIDFAIHGLL